MFLSTPKNFINPRPRSEDPQDLRLAHFVKTIELSDIEKIESLVRKDDFVILGYPDDRGVDRNGGRPGASEAPDTIRKILYNMTPGRKLNPETRIVDFGNLKSWSHNLEQAHLIARKVVSLVRRQEARIISIGGGHDWAYPDFVDFYTQTDSRWDHSHLVNFDAHLDMRPQPQEAERKNHSGTPFRKILEELGSLGQNRFSSIGLQEHCNSQSHVQWALGHRALLQFTEDLPFDLTSQWNLLNEKLDLGRSQRTRFGVSLDMDVFSQENAPGVSAPQAYGVDPRLLNKFISVLGKQMTQLGIYETNPRFDRDNATSRLAARLIFEYLHISP
jgi:formiminoglutamase